MLRKPSKRSSSWGKGLGWIVFILLNRASIWGTACSRCAEILPPVLGGEHCLVAALLNPSALGGSISAVIPKPPESQQSFGEGIWPGGLLVVSWLSWGPTVFT